MKLDSQIVNSIRGEYGILLLTVRFYSARRNIMLIRLQGAVSLGFNYYYLPSILVKGSIWGCPA